LKETGPTIVEARGTVGKVGVIKVVESLADLDRSIDVDEITAGVVLHPPPSTVDPTRGSVGVVVCEPVRVGSGSLVESDVGIDVELSVRIPAQDISRGHSHQDKCRP
jgi:hypothetical protein